MDYKTNTTVAIYSENKEASIDDIQAMVPFHIDIEHRPWGIKDLIVYFSGSITLEYEEMIGDVEVDRKVEVDLTKLKIVEVAGRSITIWGITLYLDKSGEVDYAKSEIDINMICPV